MDSGKVAIILEALQDSFKEVSEAMCELEILDAEKCEITDENKFTVIVGIVGKNKGRIVIYVGEGLVKKITMGMNGGSLEKSEDEYLYLNEFTNTFCGNAISKINNNYRGSDLRLTPPSILMGTEMRLSTPGLPIKNLYFNCSSGGEIILEIGLEGD